MPASSGSLLRRFFKGQLALPAILALCVAIGVPLAPDAHALTTEQEKAEKDKAEKEKAEKEKAEKDKAEKEKAEKEKAEKEKSAREALQLEVECAFVIDGEVIEKALRLGATSVVEKDLDDARRKVATLTPKCLSGIGFDRSSPVLTGTGDVVVVVPEDKYAAAMQAADKQLLSPRLFLNGFDQGKDAKLVSVESKDKSTSLRFHVSRGNDNRPLWAMLYGEQGLQGEVPLRVGIGWSSGGATGSQPEALGKFNQLRVSDTPAVTFAALFLLALLVATVWVIWKTDAFRDAYRPVFWQRADAFREQLKLALAKNSNLQGSGKQADDSIRGSILVGLNGGAGFVPANRTTTYELAANRALGAPADSSLHTDDALIGLAISAQEWKSVRASYSLGRLQVGLWFIFAVGAGVFLWIAFGQLPVIPPSLLALLTVSTATAATSLATDTSAGGRPFVPSKSLLFDVVSDYGDKTQVYRFQALVVNVMLLCVGIYGVVNELSLPVFDASWLGFLGLSGVAFTAGKQLAENPATGGNAAGGDKTTSGGTGSTGGGGTGSGTGGASGGGTSGGGAGGSAGGGAGGGTGGGATNIATSNVPGGRGT